jgi:N-acetylmuramoyl-L-alanine amidase
MARQCKAGEGYCMTDQHKQTRRIVIAAGHSNTDPGAVNGKTTEAVIVTEFRNLVAHYLRAAGLLYVTDGTGTKNEPRNVARGLIKPGDLAVEFHCNAAASKAATGVETLSRPPMQPLGADLCRAVADVLRIRNRGAKPENAGHHSTLGFVAAGGLILEIFFLSNDAELAAYQAKKWLVAKAVAAVLIANATKKEG